MELSFWIQSYELHGYTRFQASCVVSGKRFSCCGRGDTAISALNDLLAHF